MSRENDRYRLFVENMPDAYVYQQVVEKGDDSFVELEHIFLDINSGFEEMTGLTRDMVTGKKVSEVYPETGEAGFDWTGIYKKVKGTKKSIRCEKYYKPTDRWYDITAYSDRPGYFAVVFRDITERKIVEEAQSELAYAHQRMLTILDSMDALVYVADLKTYEILYINKYGRKDYGNVIGKKCWQILQEGQTGPCDFCTNDKLLKANGQPAGAYQWEHKKEKTQRWYDCRDTALQWIDGRMVRLEIATDITQRKESEEALQFQLQFEKIVSDISSFFVGLPTEKIGHGINYTLKLMGEFFQVDRSYFFRYSSDGKRVTCSYEWCPEGIQPQKDNIQNIPVGSLPWWAEQIKSRDYVYIPDVDKLPPEAEAEKKDFKSQDIQSILCIPMVKNNALVGFLGFDSVKGKKAWKDDQITLLKVVAEIVSNAYIRCQADEKIRHLSFHDQLTGLYNRFFLEEEMRRLDTSRQLPVSIIMADLNGLKLVNDTYRHCVGDRMLKSAANILKESCREEDIIARWGGDEFVILLSRTSEKEAWRVCKRINEKCSKTYVEDIPLSMSLGASNKDSPEKGLSEVMKEAEDHMYKNKLTERRSEKSNLLKTLLRTLSAKKSFEKEEHIQLMQNMAIRIGKKIDLPETELSRLRVLVTLHDIGKINISEDILNKKDALTEEEWEVIKQHPETGYRIARSTDEFSHVAGDILAHHERWDGTGYPQGLKGEEIPLLSRITAIAVTYESLTNGRPYKKALPSGEVVAEIKRCAGTHFDPELVEVFLSVYKEVNGDK